MFNLKKVCDEVFGEENFIDCLHWKKKKQPSFLAKHTAKLMEYVLVYGKNADQLEKLSIETLSDATKKVINISNQECVRHFSKGVRVKIGENGIIKAGRYKIKTMEVEYLQDVYYENGVTINEVDVVSKFSVSQEKIDQFIKDNLLFITENSGLRRDVSEEEKKKRKSITDLLLSEYGDNQESDNEQKDLFGNKYFDYTKPVKLVYNLTKSLIYNEDDIILDFFSGSATTAHAVMQLNAEDGGNRRFICVQLPELCDEKSEAYKAGYKNICEIGKERIRRAGKKIIEEKGDQIGIDDEEKKPLDIGFKVFKLDTSNLRIWDNTPITGDNQIEMFTERMNSMIDSIKDDRTDMDVVYEVMLKMGVPLDVPVQYIGVNEKVVYKVVYKVVHIVGDFLLMIALFDNITAEDIEAIAEYAPAKIICAEHGFADDSALSNAHYILKDRQIELKLI